MSPAASSRRGSSSSMPMLIAGTTLLSQLFHSFANSADGFVDVVARVESADAEIAFAADAEAATGGDDEVGLVEQEVEGVPARHVFRSGDPDVGGVDAAVGFQAGGGEAFADELCVF